MTQMRHMRGVPFLLKLRDIMINPPRERNLLDMCLSAFRVLLGAATLAGSLLASGPARAQTTNAFDQASDPAYAGLGAPNGLGTGGENGGFGFGPWTFTLTGSGGSFIQNNGPSGFSFDLWNTSANSGTVAVRPFNTPLSAGQSFTVSIRLNSLDNGNTTNRFALEDASGNILFSYWHVGFEANANNGSYSDATTAQGVAANFQYAYTSFVTYKFTLTSATNYTFTDLATGASFTGLIANTPIAKAAFIRRNGNTTPGNGQDYQFDQLQITSAAPPTFQNLSPAANAFSVASNSTVSLSVASGGVPLNPGSVSFKLDGAAVTPTVSGNSSLMSISYTPNPAMSLGTRHTVQVVVQDNNTVSYTNSWSFTTGYGALPVTVAGPFTTGGGNDLTLFTAAGDAWLGTNYNASSSRTIYIRQSMMFSDLNGEIANDGSGGCYGGLQLFAGTTERMLTGETWRRNTWSVDDKAGNGDVGEVSLNPETTVVIGEWHVLVERIDFNPNGNSTVKVWLDPDFTKTEDNQPYAPFQVAMDNTFDNIRLRCGNGTADATWSNIVVGATATVVGFAVPAAPTFQGIVPAPASISVNPNTAISAQVVVGGNPITAVALSVDGVSVTPSSNQVSGIISLSYQPSPALTAGTTHSVQLVVTDSSSSRFTNAWSFTTGYASLPIHVAGPFTTGGGNDLTLFSTSGEPWIGTNYNDSSSRTLYTRFSMVFNDLNGETGSGGGYGGLHFFQDNSEKLLVGNGWTSLNWSLDAAGSQQELNPQTPVILGEWHTIVIRTDYLPGGNDNVKIWLDPDFSQTEANQPNPPYTFSADTSFNNIRLRCGNGTASATWSNIVLAATSAGVGFVAPSDPQFQSYVPLQNATSASVGSPVGVTVLFGSYGIGTNTVVMKLDGNTVAPSFTTGTGSLTMSYHPAAPFAAGSSHAVSVSLTDSNGTPYSTSWSFTVDSYPALPVSVAGPFDVTGGGVGTILWNSQNGWLDGNYGTNSSATLYTRFSVDFLDLNGETGGGGGYGGLHFYQDNQERLLVGNAWLSVNWSVDAAGNQMELSSSPIVLGEWHNFVVKFTYASNALDNVKIWLDPQFNLTENGQLNAPREFYMNASFNSIHLRAGDGSAEAQFSNVVVSATSPFATSVRPALLHLVGNQLSWTSAGVLQQAPDLNGSWTDCPNQSNPQTVQTTNTAQFYRLRQ
jgi:hypothetical protein